MRTKNVDIEFFDREVSPDLGSTLTEDELREAAHDNSGKFKRFNYEDAEDGVSPRSIPGQKGGRYLATGNEHSPVGHINEDPDNRVAQMERRLEKLEAIRTELDEERDSTQTYFGPDEADYGIITWGSSQGAVEEAIERLNNDGHSVKGISVSDMMPFAEKEVTEFLESVDEAMVVEMNATGQFRGLIQKELGRYGDKMTSLLKFNGNPFEPGEVVEGYEVNVAEEDQQPDAQVRIEPAAGD